MVKATALLLSAALISVATIQTRDASPDIESELRQQTQALLDAVAPGNVEVWRRLLHERMIHVDENGIVRTKEQLLAELRPLPAGLEGKLRVAPLTCAFMAMSRWRRTKIKRS